MTAALDGGESDGRVVAVVDPEDEVTWPVERTDVFVSRTPTETWPAPVALGPRVRRRRHRR
jgi:hypothetical protein